MHPQAMNPLTAGRIDSTEWSLWRRELLPELKEGHQRDVYLCSPSFFHIKDSKET